MEEEAGMAYPGLRGAAARQYDAAMEGEAITVDDVRDFFAEVLARAPQAIQRIEQSDGDIELLPQGFVFTLPALHHLLDPQQNLAYRDFRKLLYDSTLNQELGAFDAEVTAFQSSGKVDSSRYCLRRRAGI